jgi:hypothetical protein
MLDICECEQMDSSHPLFMPKSPTASPITDDNCNICGRPIVVGWINFRIVSDAPSEDDDKYLISDIGDINA